MVRVYNLLYRITIARKCSIVNSSPPRTETNLFKSPVNYLSEGTYSKVIQRIYIKYIYDERRKIRREREREIRLPAVTLKERIYHYASSVRL